MAPLSSSPTSSWSSVLPRPRACSERGVESSADPLALEAPGHAQLRVGERLVLLPGKTPTRPKPAGSPSSVASRSEAPRSRAMRKRTSSDVDARIGSIRA